MPKYNVVLEEDAKIDIADSFDWYNNVSVIVADNFITEIKKALDYLEENPLQFKVVYKSFIQIPLKKYPFVLLYKTEENLVKIYRVFATRKNPKKRFR